MRTEHAAAIDTQRAAHERMKTATTEYDKLVLDTAATEEQRDAAQKGFDEAEAEYQSATRQIERHEAVERASLLVPRDLPPAEPKNRPEDRADLDYTPEGRSFFADLRAMSGGYAPQIAERLEKNNRHRVDMAKPEERAGLTQTATAGGEFSYPLWLNEYVPLLRAGRTLANLCTGDPLPPNTNSINVPKITTGASTAVQSDGGSVSNTDLVTSSVTAQVQTIAGRTVASYQIIDLGQGYVDRMIFKDLYADYMRTLDIKLNSSTVTNAKGLFQVTGTNAVTYTDASPTGPELYTPIFQAKSQIGLNAFAEVDGMLMHTSTWNWYLSQLDASSLPLAIFAGNNNFNRTGTYNLAGEGPSGQIAGIPVFVDANVPSTGGAGAQASIAVFNSMDLQSYEGEPKFKVADQTSITTLQYQFVLYGYAAWAFGRLPAMVSIVTGTGLITQSGF